MKLNAKLWLGIAVLVCLSPLGLLIPAHFNAGSAWGEWGIDEVRRLAGYVPQGLRKFYSLWQAPLPSYAVKGWAGKGLPQVSGAYIVSALLGIGFITLLVLLIGKILIKQRK